MSQIFYKCSICRKRCGNAGALKIHMKSHKRPEPKSNSLLKYVKLAPLKSTMKIESLAIESKPFKTVRQLKLREDPPPTVVSNPVLLRPRRRPRRSQQNANEDTVLVAPDELVATDLDKRSPHFRVAHVRHFKKLKLKYPMIEKKMYHKANANKLGVKMRAFQN